ncbi:MAG: substrate-binding domain-containing protein [Rhodoferax sp.]
MNIKELAKALGLSTSTVSRALNGYHDVNPQTRTRVAEMAQQLGYRPDAGARRLVRGRSDAIGMVYSAALENMGNPQFLETAAGLAQRLEVAGLDLLLAVAEKETELAIYDRLFNGGRVDAVIVPNTRVQDPRIAHFLARGYPFVAYGRTAVCAHYSWFDFDNDLGSHLAVEHLAGLGHRRFAYAHAPLELNFAYQRHRGFMTALERVDLQCPPQHQLGGVIDRRSGLEAAQRILALNPRPTAVVVDNNLGGVGVLRGLANAGIRLGQDMSLVVHGDVPPDTLLYGLEVTTVSQPTARRSGETLAEMALQVVHGDSHAPLQILRAPVLVVGSTTGAAL